MSESISSKEALILEILSGNALWFGLDIIKESQGVLARGLIYITLGNMEDKGLITGARTEDGRRVYQITPKGVDALADYQSFSTRLDKAIKKIFGEE